MNAFSRPDRGLFAISPIPFERMLKHRQRRKRQCEAGGVLVGRHLLNGADIIVDGVTEPLPGDRRSRFGFFRAGPKHQSAIDLAWQVSDGTETYLGEWHTHPEEFPRPSPTDFNDWSRKLREDTYSDVLFFLIVGINGVCVWEGRAGGRLTELKSAERGG